MFYHQLLSAKQKLQNKGIAGSLAHYPRRLSRYIKSHDLWWGRMVELRGNRVWIDGLAFNVNSPTITTAQKARFMFDRYERPERLIVKQFLNPALPVVEFGANIGVVSCIVNRRLRDPRRHVVIEANPTLIPLLAENRQVNECRFEIINAAVAHGAEQIRFNLSEDSLASSVQAVPGHTISVPSITLKNVLDNHEWQKCTLICDIEGSELELVEWESDVIKERVEIILMETHAKIIGQLAIDSMLARLTSLGFKMLFNRWSNVVLRRE